MIILLHAQNLFIGRLDISHTMIDATYQFLVCCRYLVPGGVQVYDIFKVIISFPMYIPSFITQFVSFEEIQ